MEICGEKYRIQCGAVSTGRKSVGEIQNIMWRSINRSKIDAGNIYLNDLRIDTLAAHRIASLGVGRSFQLTRVLDELSVTENLVLHTASGFNLNLLKSAVTKEDNNKAESIMEFPGH